MRTARDELRPARGPQALQRRIVDFERMAGEEEADSLELAPQPLGFRPRRSASLRAAPARPRRTARSARPPSPSRRGWRSPASARSPAKAAARFGLEAVEGASGSQALERLLVEGAGIEPRRHLAERNKGALPRARDQRLRLRFADPFDGAQRIMDRRRRRLRRARRNRPATR